MRRGETTSSAGLMPAGRRPRAVWLSVLVLAVAALVLVVYWPVLSARAMTLDDESYVSVNPLVRDPSWNSVRRFFTEVLEPSTVAGYYQPLTMTSLMLDWALGGRVDNLRPFHRTSLALHVLNTILIVLILHRLFGRPLVAAGVGLLFGVHPLTVEPVAWVTERKTLLAGLFSLFSIWCYLVHLKRGNVETRGRGDVGMVRTASVRAWFSLSVVAFLLALLSKPTSTPLPVLLLLLDYWPLKRLSWRAVVEKAPFLVLAGGASVVTVISQARTASVFVPTDYSTSWVPLTVCHNIVFYLCKFIWPATLTSFNAFPEPFDLSQPMLRAGVVGTALLLAVLVVSLRWTRALAGGWLFFFVAVFPTLGVIGFTHLIAADKYVYLPVLGFLMVLAWAGVRVGTWEREHVGTVRSPTTSAVLTLLPRAALAGLLVLIMAASWRARDQLGYWRDTETLYRHMLRLAPQAAMLHDDLGNELTRQGRLAEAIGEFHVALRNSPRMWMTHNNLGVALVEQGRIQEALPHFDEAMRLNPHYGAAYNSLGSALAKLGRFEEAEPHLRRALELSPHMADVHANLGGVLAQHGDWDGAVRELQEAVRLKPEFAGAHGNLGLVLARVGRLVEAAEQFRAVVLLQPDSPEAYERLGRALAQLGRGPEAVAAYEAGLRIAPDNPQLRAGLRAQEATKR